jgi:hypothetical protein
VIFPRSSTITRFLNPRFDTSRPIYVVKTSGRSDTVTLDFSIDYPDYIDGYEPVLADKGYFADLLVRTATATYRPVFYDPFRLAQEIGDSLNSGAACHVEPNLVVISVVDRTHIESALSFLASRQFGGLHAEANEHDA